MKDARGVLECATLAAYVLLENGAETYRAEEAVQRICAAHGVEQADVLALPTGVFATVRGEDGAPVTLVRRVKKRTIHLSRIEEANQISRSLVDGSVGFSDAVSRLREMSRPSDRPRQRPLPLIAAALSSGFFAAMFGGGVFEFIVSLLCGAAIQAAVQAFRREDYFRFLISLMGGGMAAAIAVAVCALFQRGDINPVIAGSIMPLLPGLAMTNAIRDTMRGDLVSGVARGAEALLVSVAIAVGVGVVMSAYLALGGRLA